MVWNLSTLIPLFALITYGMVLLVVATSRPPTPAKRAFRAYLLAMFFWSLAAFLILSGLGNTLFWFRLMIAAAVASMLAIFYFVQTFLALHRPWAALVYLYGAACIALALFTPYVVRSASVHRGTVGRPQHVYSLAAGAPASARSAPTRASAFCGRSAPRPATGAPCPPGRGRSRPRSAQ